MHVYHIIKPYYWGGTWVFDDPAKGLRALPVLVAPPDTVSKVLDSVVSRSAPRLLMAFSASEFQWPGHRLTLSWASENNGAHWYRANGLIVQCPALLRYFETVPPCIYCYVSAVRTPFSIYIPEQSNRPRVSSTGRVPQL